MQSAPLTDGDGSAVRVDRSVWWRRPAARLLDTAIFVLPVIWLWSKTDGAPTGPPDDWQFGLRLLAILAALLWLGIGWPLYEVLTVLWVGRTLGKAVFGVAVVRTELPSTRLRGAAVGRGLGMVGATGLAVGASGIAFLILKPVGVALLAAYVLAFAIPAATGRRTWLDHLVETDVVRRPLAVRPTE